MSAILPAKKEEDSLRNANIVSWVKSTYLTVSLIYLHVNKLTTDAVVGSGHHHGNLS